MYENPDPKKIYAACLLYDSEGNCVERYDKIHLFDVDLVDTGESYNESETIECGNLGLKVVAEGVEEKAQLDILEQLQCEYIQGFYFAKPMSAEALIEFITKQQPAYS